MDIMQLIQDGNFSSDLLEQYITGRGIVSIVAFMVFATLWELLWKGFGLWRAARLGQPWWFMAMLFGNTLGILPIFYMIMTRKNYEALVQSQKTPAPTRPAKMIGTS